MSGLHVESFGRGPPLVLLHGWAMHSGIWGPLREHLARQHRVHAVDLPGHGRSPPIAACTLDGIVAAVASALVPEAAPLTVLGWSMGGLVALRWARLQPQRVERLVLMCTTPCFVAAEDWPHAMSPETLARFGDELHIAWKLTVQRFLALQVHGSEHGRAALSATLELLATSDLRDEIAGIAQRSLVIAGGRDTLAWPAAGRWLAEALPRATFDEIAGAAHAPFLSHPDAVRASLAAFLDAR